jgi:hypothetical protein
MEEEIPLGPCAEFSLITPIGKPNPRKSNVSLLFKNVPSLLRAAVLASCTRAIRISIAACLPISLLLLLMLTSAAWDRAHDLGLLRRIKLAFLAFALLDPQLSFPFTAGYQSGDCGYCKSEDTNQRSIDSRAFPISSPSTAMTWYEV